MLKQDIDRICAATLQGRFGPGLIPARKLQNLMYAAGPSTHTAATIRNVAVWTSAGSGIEQGKL